MSPIYYIILVLHSATRLIACADSYLDRFTHKLTSYPRNLIRHRSREKPRTFLLRGMRQNSGYIFIKAHIEHLISLV